MELDSFIEYADNYSSIKERNKRFRFFESVQKGEWIPEEKISEAYIPLAKYMLPDEWPILRETIIELEKMEERIFNPTFNVLKENKIIESYYLTSIFKNRHIRESADDRYSERSFELDQMREEQLEEFLKKAFNKVKGAIGGLAGAAGSMGGAKIGGMLGGAIGSIIPGAGTAIGAGLGSALGGAIGGKIGNKAGSAIGGDKKTSGIFGKIGNVASMAVGGGGAAGGGIGKALGSVFGGGQSGGMVGTFMGVADKLAQGNIQPNQILQQFGGNAGNAITQLGSQLGVNLNDMVQNAINQGVTQAMHGSAA